MTDIRDLAPRAPYQCHDHRYMLFVSGGSGGSVYICRGCGTVIIFLAQSQGKITFALSTREQLSAVSQFVRFLEQEDNATVSTTSIGAAGTEEAKHEHETIATDHDRPNTYDGKHSAEWLRDHDRDITDRRQPSDDY